MAKFKVTNLHLLLEADERPQYEISSLAGVAPTQLSEYKLGRREMPLAVVHRLARVLGVGVDDVLGEVELDTPNATHE